MKVVFIDTGAFVALNDRKDAHHARAMKWLRAYRGRFVTSGDVLDESITRLRYDAGLEPARRLREQVAAMEQRQRLAIVWRDRDLHTAAWEVLDRFDDIALSFTDAVNISIARTRRCEAVFGFDEDFAAAGFVLVPSR